MKVDRIDAAILAKELAKIYSTPTPKGWLEPKKVIDFVFDWLILSTIADVDIYTRSLDINPIRALFVTIFGIKRKHS